MFDACASGSYPDSLCLCLHTHTCCLCAPLPPTHRNTLAFFHLPFGLLADAAKDALSALRSRKLISLRPDGPEGPSHWELTPLGSAVVASALDPDTGA